MKILSRDQIQAADAYTMEHEPIASINLMERASSAFVKAFTKEFPTSRPVFVLTGNGNNGGDGLAISRLLVQQEFQVWVIAVKGNSEPSPDFRKNWQWLPTHDLLALHEVSEASAIPHLPPRAVVIDAMLGSGLNRPLKGLLRDVVEHLNNQPATIVAVDVPTGLYCDTVNTDPAIIRASYTFTFELPKLTFMLPESHAFIGHFRCLPIGLSSTFIAQTETSYQYLSATDVAPLIRDRSPFQHKGDFGHALLLAGAYGTIGAAQLTAHATLRTGAGLLTVATPACGYTALQTAIPEAMLKPDPCETHLTTLPALERYQAIGIGPGIGQHPETHTALSSLLDQWDKPLVLDADALNLLSQEPALWAKLPSKSILTPHPGEFDRLAGRHTASLERIQRLQALAREQQVTIVLKGGHTAIATPDGQVIFNSTGNPGMGTAGSGDALTGVLTGLLSQGYEPVTAALLGVYSHGLAGDLAAQQVGYEGLMARDLLHHLPNTFRQIHTHRDA